MNNYIGTEKIKKGTVLRIEGHIGNIELVNQDSWRVDTGGLLNLNSYIHFLCLYGRNMLVGQTWVDVRTSGFIFSSQIYIPKGICIQLKLRAVVPIC